MATTQTEQLASDPIKKRGLPIDRDYDSPELAELDASLEKAIYWAEKAEYGYLVDLLCNELGSLYYGTR